MSNEIRYLLIAKMHSRLSTLIQKNNYNLMADEVQHYSKRLDKVVYVFMRRLEKGKIGEYR